MFIFAVSTFAKTWVSSGPISIGIAASFCIFTSVCAPVVEQVPVYRCAFVWDNRVLGGLHICTRFFAVTWHVSIRVAWFTSDFFKSLPITIVPVTTKSHPCSRITFVVGDYIAPVSTCARSNTCSRGIGPAAFSTPTTTRRKAL